MDKSVDNLLKSRGKIPKRICNIFHLSLKPLPPIPHSPIPHSLIPFLLLSLVLLSSFSLSGQTRLSPQAQIGVLTCDPGPYIYSTFGHTCFHVFDPTNGINEVYNYGTFDFQAPGFVRKFVQGKLNYILSIEDYQRFRYFYMHNKQSVYEQVLLLSPEERQNFYTYLHTNALPENREYLYDYFFKNCSTVPRDILFEQLGDSLQVDSSIFEPTDLTLRGLIHEKLTRLPWMKFGIDLILGMKIDKKTSIYGAMFLPDQLMTHLSTQKRIANQQAIPLVAFENQVVHGQALSPYSGILPKHVTWVLFALVALFTLWQYLRRSSRTWLDSILFLIAGLAGVTMIIMWIGTDHSTTSQNLNLLWALPTHLVAGIALMRKKLPSWLKPYFLSAAILHTLFLLFHSFLSQVFPFAIFPFIGALLIRSVYLWKRQSFS